MGVIVKDDRQITLYYHSGTSLGKQTYAYVTTSEKKLLAIDIAKNKVTGTQWAEMADNLGITVCELIDMDHPDFVALYGRDKRDLDWEDCLKILDKNPIVLAYPIVINGGSYKMIKTPSEFVNYLSADSSGIQSGEGAAGIKESD